MHQLANSVIIFDEVQTIPVRCVHMFNIALRFLVRSCGSSIVLSTATQPLLDKVVPSQRALSISKEQHMIKSEGVLYEKLKRVEVLDKRKQNGWSDDEVAELVRNQRHQKGSVLVVVNTRKSARSLFYGFIS